MTPFLMPKAAFRLAAGFLFLPLLYPVPGSGEPLHEGDDSAFARTIRFSGYTWAVKESGSGRMGPGPNFFSSSRRNVWVDAEGRLHLKITKRDGRWYSAEIGNTQSLGYGTYSFRLDSRVDAAVLDRNVVLGLFTWSDDPAFNHREIDIEFSEWGSGQVTNTGSWTVQPWQTDGNSKTFRQPAASNSKHSFTWRPDSVTFRNSRLANPWTYSGPDVPSSGDEKTRLNLWLFAGKTPTNGKAAEVIVKSFTFTPLDQQMDWAPVSPARVGG
jgi:hypothetical protein